MTALEVVCLFCGAQPGKPCTRYGGGEILMDEPHMTRQRTAEES